MGYKDSKQYPLVWIVLLNYKGCQDTIECIESLEQITYPNYRIIVVDNDSKDGSEETLRNKFPQHIIIQSGDNLGFSGGNNVGIKYALENRADYILLLNNDTLVEPNFLEPLVEESEKDKSIGIAAGKINYYYDKNIIWAAGGYISEIKGCGYHYGINQEDLGQYDIRQEVSFLTGCIQLIKREVLEKVGLYDEDYFLYMEDVDYCCRVKKTGFKLMYVPKSKIYHKVSASTGENSPLMLYYMNRNRLLFIRKNYKVFLNNMLFYIFFFLSRIINVRVYKQNTRFIIRGIKDYYKGHWGKQDFNI